MFESEFIVAVYDSETKNTVEMMRGLTPGQAIEAFQLLLGRNPDGDVLISQTVNPARLVERIAPRKIARKAVDAPEIKEAADRDGAKIALPGQYPPHVISPFTPVQHDPKRASNDCSIIAIANVFQMTYSDAKVMAFQYGWSSSKGMPRGFLELLCDNHDLVSLFRPDLCNRPLDYFCDSPPDGVFIVYVASHVMPCIHGKLYNLSGTGWQTVQEVFEIQPRSVVEKSNS